MVGFYVTKELKAELEQLAKQEKRSLSNYITIILEEHIKQKTQNEGFTPENKEDKENTTSN